MPNPRTQAARERERRAARRQEAIRQARRAARRKQILVGVFGVGLIAALAAGLLVAARAPSTTATGSTTTAPGTPSTTLPDPSNITVPDGPPVSLPAVAPGATLTGETPCPAADGSSPRTTQFAQAPPLCIDPARRYQAVVHTTEGDLTFLLNTEQSTPMVNAFVVLARYHFWDGAPITTIEPRVAFRSAGFLGAASPGFTLPNDTPPQGSLQVVGSPSFAVGPGGSPIVDPGRFQVALGEESAGLPRDTPVFGILLDDGAREGTPGTLQAIRRAGSRTGEPTKVVTITSIEVTEA